MESRSDIGRRLAARLLALRAERGLTLERLAARSGVARSTTLIERAETSPTAVVLDRLATGLGVPLASLFDPPPADPAPLARRAEQPLWEDPKTGYRRRNLSPPGFGGSLRLVQVTLPPGARVAYEAGLADRRQQIRLLEGTLEVGTGAETHRLEPGDCLAIRIDRPVRFADPGTLEARYLVAVAREPFPTRTNKKPR